MQLQLARWPLIFRLGPNPLLTSIIIAGAGLEIWAAFMAVDSSRVSFGYFHSFIVACTLFFWLSVVWAPWAILAGARKLPLGTITYQILVLICSVCVYVLILAYIISWFSYWYTGVFPVVESVKLMMANAGSGFILSFLQEAFPSLTGFFYLFCAALLFAIPLTLGRIFHPTWRSSSGVPARSSGLYWWLGAVGISVISLTQILIGTQKDIFKAELSYIQNRLTPAISISSSVLKATGTDEKVEPIISHEALTKIDHSAKEPLIIESDLSTKPSVVFIAVESLRADLLFKMHQGIEVTPNLNRLARSSVVFTKAWAQSTHTDYSVPSMLSSLYPVKAVGHHYSKRSDPWPKQLIYDHLSANGYSSGIITSDNTSWGTMREIMWSNKLEVFLDSQNMPTTYTTGSDNHGYVDNPEVTEANGAAVTPDNRTIDTAIEWIKGKITQKRPYFFYTMFQNSHFPYTPKGAAKRPFQPAEVDFHLTFSYCSPDNIDILRNKYLNAVHSVDFELGRFLKFLEEEQEMQNTIIVLCGDHGEAFREHGLITHAGPLYEEVVRVPTIIYVPGATPRSIDYPIEQVDLAPTLCGLLKIPTHPTYQGIDVLSEDRPPLDVRDVFVHAAVPDYWHGEAIVRGGRWKYWIDRYDNRELLFDLQSDPGETKNIKEEFPALSKSLRTRLKEWRQNQLAYYEYNIFYDYYYPPKHYSTASQN